MKFHVETNQGQHDVEIKREGDRVFARVDDREYELDVSEPEANVFLLKQDGRIAEAVVSKSKVGDPTHVRIGSDEFEIRLIDPKRLRGSGSGVDNADGIAEIKTAMPGKVVRVLVERGAEVAKGDGVLVVEAMKMQNEMKAPKSGVVKELRVVEGATVSAGDILATIE